MKYVIFDFNGTVLDDVDVCIKAENHTIEHFHLDREPLTKEEYLKIFTFPVKDYYEMFLKVEPYCNYKPIVERIKEEINQYE